MSQVPYPRIQIVPCVGGVRANGTSQSANSYRDAPALSAAAGLRLASLLAVATFLIDVVGASQERSVCLAISAVQSGSQLLMAGAIVAVTRHRPICAQLPFDLIRVEALVQFVSGLILAVLSIPIAYRAFGSLWLPGECDATESACILALGLCSSVLSAWLLSRASPTAPVTGSWSASLSTVVLPRREHHGLLTAAVTGQLADLQVSAVLLVAMVVSGLCGWAWVDAFAGLVGAFVLSFAAARFVTRSGAVLIDARSAAPTV